MANQNPRGSRFLVNGEPTDNRIAVASKGALRVEVTARGRMAHSAYPELGESAIEKLLDALQALRAMQLPHNPEIGPSTVNIGIIEGGRATNVIPDFAKAQLLYRLVGPSEKLRSEIVSAVGSLAEVEFVLDIPYMRFLTVPGIETMTASFTTDIPALSAWGKPVLLGPGSILVAHTDREFLAKAELMRAIELYVEIGNYPAEVRRHPFCGNLRFPHLQPRKDAARRKVGAPENCPRRNIVQGQSGKQWQLRLPPRYRTDCLSAHACQKIRQI